jgi:predicted nucleic acid-binding protein
MLRLDARIARAEVVHSGPELVLIYAQLRAECEAQGHALGQREHNADRWIAATAIRLGVPLVSNDGIFRSVPGLELETFALP